MGYQDESESRICPEGEGRNYTYENQDKDEGKGYILTYEYLYEGRISPYLDQDEGEGRI